MLQLTQEEIENWKLQISKLLTYTIDAISGKKKKPNPVGVQYE